MKSITKRLVISTALIAIFASTTTQMPIAYSSESTLEAKQFDFLSNVVGLDLAKYTIIPPTFPPGYEDANITEVLSDRAEKGLPSSSYPSKFGGLVKEEALSYDLEYNVSKIDVMSIFYNGQMVFLDIDHQDDYVYSEVPSTDLLSQAENILQRYQTFASQWYADDASYLVSMNNVLRNIEELSLVDVTDGNVNFQISKDGNNTLIQWVYTEGGISMDWKRVSIEFCNNAFESFVDTWGFYSVSGLSKISSEEAFQIALEAAQNYEFNLTGEKGEIVARKVPDLSNAFYQEYFTMVPFRYGEDKLPSRIERDPLTLYPFWQYYFYFNETILGYDGVQVGVWGDTSELVYYSGFGYYGTFDIPNEQDTSSQSLANQQPEDTLNLSTLVIAASLVAVSILSIFAIILHRKKRNK
jgi:hypothetical protein